MANAPTNAQLFSSLMANNPKFNTLSVKSQADFVSKAIPAINAELSGGQNEVVSALVNRISGTMLNDLKLRNPLSMFEMSPSAYGAFMEEYGVHRVEETRFRDSDDPKDQFAFLPSKVDQAIYKISRRSQYATSIEDEITRQAFLDEYGLSQLLTSLVARLDKSNQADTYIYMRRLFDLFFSSDVIRPGQIIGIPDIRDESLSVNDIRTAISRIKRTCVDMTFNNDKYNAIDRVQCCDIEDLTCVMDFNAYQQNEVQNLSQAFNTSFLDYQTPVIQVDGFEDDGIIAVLCDKRAFGFHNMAPPVTSQAYDAKKLHQNYFLTLIQMFHASPFCNMAYLVTEEKAQEMRNKINGAG